jgi:hypothetical protein
MSKLGVIVAVWGASLGLASLGVTASAVALPASSPAASPGSPPFKPPTKPTGCPLAGSSHATTPPALALLEQKMQHLHASTIRFAVRLVLGTQESTIEFAFTGEGQRSPSETKVITKGVVHKHSGSELHEGTEKREIGNTRYTYEPASTHGDGGRPWVREQLTHEQVEEEEKGSVTKQGTIATGPFAIGLLNSAQSIEAAGQATLDGHTVEQFNLTFAPGQYPNKELPFGELFEDEFCQPVVNVSLSIDPSGVPVRASVSTTYHNSKRTITTLSSEEITAIDFPFTPLKPPPAKQTISEAALRKLQLKRLGEKLRKLKREQAHKRPDHPDVRHPVLGFSA